MKFIDDIKAKIEAIPHHMDFEGQRKAENMFHYILGTFTIVGFIWGYVCQQLSQSVYIVLAGFVLCCLLVLPPWPFYRRNSLSWQKVCDIDEKGDTTADTKKEKATSKPKKLTKKDK